MTDCTTNILNHQSGILYDIVEAERAYHIKIEVCEKLLARLGTGRVITEKLQVNLQVQVTYQARPEVT